MTGLLATVFDIQRFCVHDGPGIRTVVFFKGCSLNCSWCQNPESLRRRPEVTFFAESCIDCFECEAACPQDAILREAERVDWGRCDHCGSCAATCPADSLREVGWTYGAEELTTLCLRDKAFARASGGGVTLSGGEPVLQSDFLREFLPLLAQGGLPVLLETAGHYPWRLLEPLLPSLDTIYFDYKLPDSAAYRTHTGQGSERILENLGRLVRSGFDVQVRMPMLPGLNEHPDQIATACRALRGVGVERVHLLEYNALWEAKLPRLSVSRPWVGRAPAPRPARGGECFARNGLQAVLT